MNKLRWQLAKILEAPYMPNLVGKTVWTDSELIEPCGDYGCKSQAIGINVWEKDFMLRKIQQVIHTKSIELLPVFSDEVEPTSYEELEKQKGP